MHTVAYNQRLICDMKIAAQPLIFGASYFCLLRTAFAASSASSTCEASTRRNMSATPPTIAPYVPGSSSVAYITTPDEASAKKLAHSLVEARLAACVNIIPKITSIYVWEDQVNEDSECMLIVKTRTSRVKELTKFVRDNHSYSVAEVITTAIQNGNPPYLEWIERTVPDAKEEE